MEEETKGFDDGAAAVVLPRPEKRRRRCKFSNEALQVLQAHATVHGTYPTPADRAALAARIDASPRQVQVWFQNQRQRGAVGQCRGSLKLRYDFDFVLVARLLQTWSGGAPEACVAQASLLLGNIDPHLGDEFVEHALCELTLQRLWHGLHLADADPFAAAMDAVYADCNELVPPLLAERDHAPPLSLLDERDYAPPLPPVPPVPPLATAVVSTPTP